MDRRSDQQDNLNNHGDRLTDVGINNSRLKPGGPTPSYPLIIAYIDGLLDTPERKHERELVETAIGRWKDWFDAFLEMRRAAYDCLSTPKELDNRQSLC